MSAFCVVDVDWSASKIRFSDRSHGGSIYKIDHTCFSRAWCGWFLWVFVRCSLIVRGWCGVRPSLVVRWCDCVPMARSSHCLFAGGSSAAVKFGLGDAGTPVCKAPSGHMGIRSDPNSFALRTIPRWFVQCRQPWKWKDLGQIGIFGPVSDQRDSVGGTISARLAATLFVSMRPDSLGSSGAAFCSLESGLSSPPEQIKWYVEQSRSARCIDGWNHGLRRA